MYTTHAFDWGVVNEFAEQVVGAPEPVGHQS